MFDVSKSEFDLHCHFSTKVLKHKNELIGILALFVMLCVAWTD